MALLACYNGRSFAREDIKNGNTLQTNPSCPIKTYTFLTALSVGDSQAKNVTREKTFKLNYILRKIKFIGVKENSIFPNVHRWYYSPAWLKICQACIAFGDVTISNLHFLPI